MTESLKRIVPKIYAEVLEMDRVELTDSFLDLGGTSLQAIRICARIERELGLQASPAGLLSHDVVEEFLQHLRAEQGGSGE